MILIIKIDLSFSYIYIFFFTISTKTRSLQGGADRGAIIRPNEHYTLYTFVKSIKIE